MSRFLRFAFALIAVFASTASFAHASLPQRGPATSLDRAAALARAGHATPRHATTAAPGAPAPAALPADAQSAPDGAGGLFMAWTDRRDGNDDAYVLRVTAAGAPAAGWPAQGLRLTAVTGAQRVHGVVADGAGGAIVAWSDQRAGESSDELWAQRVNASGVAMWTANGVLVATDAFAANQPLVAADGIGGLLCSWRRDGTTDTDVMATRVNASGATPSGWSVDGVVACGAAGNQEPRGVVGDGAGGAYVVWDDYRTDAMVYAQHLSAAGAAIWAADGQRVDAADGAGYTVACTDGSGGVLLAWTESDGARGQRLNAAGAAQWSAGGERMFASESTFDLDLAPLAGGGALLTWVRTVAGESEVRAQRVTSAGAIAWDSTGVVVAHAGPGYAYGYSAVSDGSGGAVVTWLDRRNAAPGEFALWVQRVSAAGAPMWGTDGVPVAIDPTRPDRAELAGDGAGGALLVWYDYRSSGETVRAQRFDAAGVPQLAANGVVLVGDEASQYEGPVVADGAGGVWLVWEQTVGGQGDLYARHLASNGQPAGPKVLLCDAPGAQWLWDVTSDGAGGVLVAWRDERPSGSGGDFYAQRVTAAGTVAWAANGALVSGGGVRNMALTPDGSGGAFAVWGSYTADVRAQRLSAAGAPLWGASGANVCLDSGAQYQIVLTPDGVGGAIVAWDDDRVPGDHGLYAQRLNGSGVAQWTANGSRIGSFGADAFYPVGLVGDGAAGAIVVMLSSEYDAQAGVFRDSLHVQRVNSAGAPQWSPRGTHVTTTSGELDHLRFAADGLGGVVLGFSEERSAPANVYAQRVSASGAVQWTAGGLVVCDAAGAQRLSGLAGDGAGGALLSWADERGGESDVYAQKLAASGAAQWGANGVAVIAAARGQYAGGLAADGAGGAFVSWVDNASGTVRNVAAQHLASNGAGTWGPGGVTSVLASLSSASLDETGAHVEWQLADAAPVTIERAAEGGPWVAIAERAPDGERRVRLDDDSMAPSERRGYRVRRRGAGGDLVAGEVWLEPATVAGLALSPPSPNPARGAFALAFTLDASGPATLDLFDVGGRLVERHALGAPSAGRHVMRVGERLASAGVYFARLAQGGREARVRIVVAK